MPSGNCNIVIVVNELSPWDGPTTQSNFEIVGDFYVRRNDGQSQDVHRLTTWCAVVPFTVSEKQMRKLIIQAAVERAAAIGFIVDEQDPIVLVGQPQLY
jgi:hypothetical protein